MLLVPFFSTKKTQKNLSCKHQISFCWKYLFWPKKSKCEKCGKLIHLHCEDVVKLEQHLMDSHGFRMDPCRTVFYGICEECRSVEDEASETVHMKAR